MDLKNELVVKSNRLIEASYRLGLVEQYIVLLAIVQARETGKGLNSTDFVSITVKDYVENFEADAKSAYAQMKEASRTLFDRRFILYDTHPETGKERATQCRWVSAASYIDGAERGELGAAEHAVAGGPVGLGGHGRGSGGLDLWDRRGIG